VDVRCVIVRVAAAAVGADEHVPFSEETYDIGCLVVGDGFGFVVFANDVDA
jgi:hypothetical protein